MAQSELIRIAEHAYGALNSGDLERFLEIVDPDVEFRSLVAEAEAQHYRGHQGVREWYDAVARALGGLHFEVEELHDLDGTRGWARLMVTGTVEGVEVPQRMYQGVMQRDGKAIWWATYRTLRETLAGLEERGLAPTLEPSGESGRR